MAASTTIKWTQLTYAFAATATATATATAASHEVVLSFANAAGAANVLVDDVTVTEDARTEKGTGPIAPSASETVTDTVVRSQAGRIVSNTVTDRGATALNITWSLRCRHDYLSFHVNHWRMW